VVERPQLAAQAKPIVADEVKAHENELERALGGLDEGLVGILLDLDPVVLPKRGGEPLIGARPVVDEEQLGVEPGLRDRGRQGSPMPKSREAMARVRISSVTAFSRTRLRTRAMSAVSSTGLVRKSSAPARSPATRSDG